MLALFLAPAWAGTWTIQLPPDQRPADWAEALELTGLVAAASGAEAHARVSCAADTCQLAIRDGDGWRTTPVPPPHTAESRELIALKARSMLQERAEIHNEWRPDLSALLTEPEPEPPTLPTFTVPAPALSPYPAPEATYSSHVPYEIATWPEALQPEVLVEEHAPLLPWGSLVLSGERRSTAGFGVSGGASGGVAMFGGRLGIGADLTGHSPTRFDPARSWSTLGLAGVLWGRPADRLQLSGLIGGHRLRFTDAGSAADTIQRTFAAAELSTPVGPLWISARLTSDLAPVTLYEVDQWGRESVLAELGTLWSGQVGARWFWF